MQRLRVKKHGLDYCIYAFIVVLIIYQDSPLGGVIGNAGVSVIPLLSIIGAVTSLFFTKKIYKNILIITYFHLLIYTTVVSIIAVVIWAFFDGRMILYGEFLPVKALKGILTISAYPAFMYLIGMLTSKLNEDELFKPIYITFFILIIICLVESTQLPYAFKKLHAFGEFPYYRIRLLTKESSWTAVMIFNYSFFSMYYALKNRKRLLSIMIIIGTIYLLWTSGSKTLMTIVIIFFLLLLFYTVRTDKKKIVAVVLVVAVFGFITYKYLWPKLSASYISDITNYASTSARIYTNLVALCIGILIPTGVGNAVYLGVFPAVIKRYLELFSSIYPFKFNASHLLRLVNGASQEGLTAKSGICQGTMVWGVIGTVYLMRTYTKIYKSLLMSSVQYKELLLVILVSNIIFVTFSNDFCYEFFLGIYLCMICSGNYSGGVHHE